MRRIPFFSQFIEMGAPRFNQPLEYLTTRCRKLRMSHRIRARHGDEPSPAQLLERLLRTARADAATVRQIVRRYIGLFFDFDEQPRCQRTQSFTSALDDP